MMTTERPTALLVPALLATLLLLAAGPAAAETVTMNVPFQLDEWTEIEVEDGGVTLHRIRLAEKQKNIKSKIFRPGNSEFLKSVQIQLDYTNDTNRDRDATIRVFWKDSEGRIIDGYDDEEELDEDERDTATVLLSTLAYGLEVAATLDIEIIF